MTSLLSAFHSGLTPTLKRPRHALTGFCLLAMASATWAVPAPELERQLAMDIGHQLIQPAYQQLAETTDHLSHDAEAYCQTAGSSLEAVQRSYRDSLNDWMRVQAINWGPAEKYNRNPSMYFWPDKKNISSRQLNTLINNADPAVLDPAAFSQASIAVSGLSAIERLLFDSPPPQPNSYRCQLLSAISANTARISQQLVVEWPTYVQQWQTDSDPLKGIRLLLKSMDEVAQIISQQKLAMPMGSELSKSRASRAESYRSASSLANIRANWTFITSLLQGNSDQPGLLKLISRENDELAETLRGLIFTTDHLLKAMDFTLEHAISDPEQRGKLMMLQANIDTMQSLLSTDVSGTLGITLGFNSRDGD
ncbi:hypothetical protein C4K68_20565 [Pokkaliibacter plantistimulans]|uniref:Imelysin-like domain-containing protein n=1 Tax=Proteobacteria bacterium 228 TaxID=2083153 RepID=A0A2S5KLC0_9PROT|nr:imelysin family protein [Pokkaliibacter plantistimulans]PPC75443.1 hypothetical protein C4K68_20565 [Pokkaliibacter plantistimulans]